MLRIRLHVKSLNGCRVAVDHDRPVEFIGDDGLFVAANVVAEFCGIVVFVENTDGFFVADVRKGRLNVFEFFCVALQ